MVVSWVARVLFLQQQTDMTEEVAEAVLFHQHRPVVQAEAVGGWSQGWWCRPCMVAGVGEPPPRRLPVVVDTAGGNHLVIASGIQVA